MPRGAKQKRERPIRVWYPSMKPPTPEPPAVQQVVDAIDDELPCLWEGWMLWIAGWMGLIIMDLSTVIESSCWWLGRKITYSCQNGCSNSKRRRTQTEQHLLEMQSALVDCAWTFMLITPNKPAAHDGKRLQETLVVIRIRKPSISNPRYTYNTPSWLRNSQCNTWEDFPALITKMFACEGMPYHTSN